MTLRQHMEAAASKLPILAASNGSFGRDLSHTGKTVQKLIDSGALKPYEVSPKVSGISRPMVVLLATRKASFIKFDFHGDADTFCPPRWLDIAIGRGACGFGCRICFLMLTHRAFCDPLRPWIYINVEDFLRVVADWLVAKSCKLTIKVWNGKKFVKTRVDRPRSPQHSIGLGVDCADSLLFEGVTHQAQTQIPLFTSDRTNPLHNLLVLLTKSANTFFLAELSDRVLRRRNGKVPNVVITMSLNPEAIADLWEGKFPDTLERITPSIEKRLEALRAAQDMGFEVRARIDPILTPEGWQEHYEGFFNDMAHRFGVRPTMLTLGTYREKNAQLDTQRAKWGLPAMEWEPEKTVGREGTHVHAVGREAVYTTMREIIFKAFKGTGFTPAVSLCKETHALRATTDFNNAQCNCLNAGAFASARLPADARVLRVLP